MICPNCGHDCTGIDGRFCPVCGANLYPYAYTQQPPKKQKKIGIYPIIAIVVIAIIAVVVVATRKKTDISDKQTTSRSSTSTAVQSSSSRASSATSSKPTFELVESGVCHDDNSYYSTVRSYFVVKNTNDYPVYFDCDSIDYEDADGHLLAIDNLPNTFPPVIGPGERGYMFSSRMLDDPLDPDAKVSFKDNASLRKATVKSVRLQVTEINLSQNGKKVLGRVWNNTNEVQTLVYVSGVLYHDKTCIGYFETSILNDIPVDGKGSFETYAHFLSDELSSQEVTSYEVYAYPLTVQW